MAAMEMVKGDRTVMVQSDDVGEWEKRGYRVLGPFPFAPESKPKPVAEEAAPAKKPTTRKE